MENKVEKAVEKNNRLAKYGVTKKSIYSLLSVGFCLILIIVLSFTGAKFDLKALEDPTYWISVAINSGLCIYGMITGQQIGDDLSRNNTKGQFRLSLTRYSAAFKSVDESEASSHFEEWLENYRERKLKRKIRRYLKDNGIHQLEVLDLSYNELSELSNPFKKDWSETGHKDKYFNEKTNESVTYFRAYTPLQIDIIRQCLDGEIKVSQLPESFFMNAFNQREKDTWESASNSSKKKNWYLGWSYTYKLLGLFLLTTIFSGLGRDPYEQINISNTLIQLASRLFTVFTAVVWGIYIGMELVKIDIVYIDFKSDILNKCAKEFKSGEYKVESLEEKAKKEYEKYEREKPKTEIVMDDIPLTGTIYLTNNKEEKKDE